MWETFSFVSVVLVSVVVGIIIGACGLALARSAERDEMDNEKKAIESDKKLVATQREMLTKASTAMLDMSKATAAKTARRSA